MANVILLFTKDHSSILILTENRYDERGMDREMRYKPKTVCCLCHLKLQRKTTHIYFTDDVYF